MKKTIIILAAIILFISCGDKKKSTTDNGTSTETNTTSNSDGDSEKTGEFSELRRNTLVAIKKKVIFQFFVSMMKVLQVPILNYYKPLLLLKKMQ